MFSNKMDFSSCVIWIDFYKSGHIYRIALNHGLGIYFFPAIFNQVTKRDGCLLSEETHAVYNL